MCLHAACGGTLEDPVCQSIEHHGAERQFHAFSHSDFAIYPRSPRLVREVFPAITLPVEQVRSLPASSQYALSVEWAIGQPDRLGSLAPVETEALKGCSTIHICHSRPGWPAGVIERPLGRGASMPAAGHNRTRLPPHLDCTKRSCEGRAFWRQRAQGRKPIMRVNAARKVRRRQIDVCTPVFFLPRIFRAMSHSPF